MMVEGCPARIGQMAHLSRWTLVNLAPNLGMLEPLFKACEKDPHARRALLECFTGDAPVYSLLKHPEALASALKDGLLRGGAALRS